MQDESVQYVGPYGAIPLASEALHVEVCHKQTACNKCLGREHRFFLLWETGARHRLAGSGKPILAFLRLYHYAPTDELFVDLH